MRLSFVDNRTLHERLAERSSEIGGWDSLGILSDPEEVEILERIEVGQDNPPTERPDPSRTRGVAGPGLSGLAS